MGDTQAAVNATQLANQAGLLGSASGTVGQAIPYVGAALALYNYANNYQSGNTVSDAEQGAEVGSMFGPWGAVIGAAAGALTSAFGGGENDPETLMWNNVVQQASSDPQALQGLSPSGAYTSLAGIMDAKNNSGNHSTPLEQVFGRSGENNFLSQMASQVNNALSSGKIPQNASASQIYSKIVTPWLKSKGAYTSNSAIVSSNGTQNNGSMDALLTGIINDWQSGALTAYTGQRYGAQGYDTGFNSVYNPNG